MLICKRNVHRKNVSSISIRGRENHVSPKRGWRTDICIYRRALLLKNKESALKYRRFQVLDSYQNRHWNWLIPDSKLRIWTRIAIPAFCKYIIYPLGYKKIFGKYTTCLIETLLMYEVYGIESSSTLVNFLIYIYITFLF